MKTEIFSLENISRQIDNDLVIDHLSLRLFEGEILGVCAPNTLECSSFVDVVSCAAHADQGQMMLDGVRASYKSIDGAQRRGLYCITAKEKMIANFSVAENIWITKPHLLSKYWFNKKKMFCLLRDALKFYGLRVDVRMKARELSEYEKKMIEIVRAVMRHARILVLHDVLSRCTEAEKEDFIKVISRLKSEGISIIFVSMDIDYVSRITDRVLVLRNGKEEGLFCKGEYDEKKLFRALTQGRNEGGNIKKCHGSNEELLRWEEIRTPACAEPFSGDLRKGEAIAFMNEKGKPARDMLDILRGRLPYKGSLTFQGGSVKALRKVTGVISKASSADIFIPNMTLGENLILMKYPGYANKLTFLKKNVSRFALHEYTQLYSLNEKILGCYPQEADLYTRMVFQFVKWLIAEPVVLLLDEPFADMDAAAKKDLYYYVDLIKQKGIGMIYYSPLATETEEICDRIYLFENGRMSRTVSLR